MTIEVLLTVVYQFLFNDIFLNYSLNNIPCPFQNILKPFFYLIRLCLNKAIDIFFCAFVEI